MRIILFLTTTLITTTFNTFCQVNNDSIFNKVLPELQREDQVSLLDSVCELYSVNLWPDGDTLFSTRLQLIQDLNDFKQEEKRIKETVQYYYDFNKFDKAYKFLTQYIPKIDSIQRAENRLLVYYMMAEVQSYRQEFESSIRYADLCISTTEPQAVENYYHRKCYDVKGYCQAVNGNYNDAYKNLSRSKELSISANDSLSVFKTMVNISILYSQIGLYNEAETELFNRYKFVNPSDDERFIDYVNIGRNLIIQKDYNKALKYYHSAFKYDLPPLLKNTYHMYAYNGIAEIHYRLNNGDSLFYYFSKLEEEFNESGQDEWLAFLYDQTKLLYDIEKKNYSEAEVEGQRLYHDAINGGDPADIILYSDFLSEIYLRSQNYKKAYDYLKQKAEASDSLNSVNKARGLSLYKTQFETEKKEREIIKLSSEKALSDARWKLWLAISLLSFVITAVGFFFYIKLKRARNLIAERNNELQNLNSTKDKFFNIIAHDLRSPIASLQSVDRQMTQYIDEDDKDKLRKVSSLVGKTSYNLSSLLDNLLKWALSQTGNIPFHPEVLSLKDELTDTISLYEQQLFEKNIKLKVVVEDDIKIFADRSAIKTIIRNLYSNAIKYSNEHGSIEIRGTVSSGFVQLDFQDNGLGMDKPTLQKLFSLDKKSIDGTKGEKGTGLGLLLVKELVELHNGVLEVKSELNVGSTFIIRFPQA